MSKLDLEWLLVFDEVYRTRSVSRAAEHLGMAQATASIALNKLRAHFGDKLFSRTPGGMQPTTYAAEIRPALRQVCDILAQAQRSRVAFDPRASARTFRICMTDIRQVVMLPKLVNHLRKVAPQIRIEAEPITEQSPLRMEEGRVELAVGHMPQVDTGFFQRTLMDEDFVCLAAARHPRISKRLARSTFLKESHVFVDMSGTGHSIVEKTLAGMRIDLDVGLRVPSFLGVAKIVAQTELLTVVPRSLGEAFAGQERVKVWATPIAFPSYSVRLHWHERFHADPGNVWLRGVIAELFQAKERKGRGPAPTSRPPVPIPP